MTTGLAIDLHGKKALVTGGSRGIGAGIAIRLAEAGADVAINYLRNKKPAEETAAAVRAKGRKAVLVKGNVADADAIPPMFEVLGNEFGRLDILVSNAASGVIKPAMELTHKHWTHAFSDFVGWQDPPVVRLLRRCRSGSHAFERTTSAPCPAWQR